MWRMPSILTEPWNPSQAPTGLRPDADPRHADSGTIANPYTGLPMPQRIERAEVTIEEGLPVGQNADWVELHFAPEIPVPADAWADWDPVAQRFITVAEKFPGGTTALRKSVVYYPEDLYSTVFWHDGSPFSVGDIVMGIILTFDRGKPGSPIFDEVEQPVIEAFLRSFKGVRIVSVDPLVIETYSDTYFLDAELNVSTWFPLYAQGPGAWHNLALGVRAESQEELAFSTAKADQLDVEWMNFVAGPSLGDPSPPPQRGPGVQLHSLRADARPICERRGGPGPVEQLGSLVPGKRALLDRHRTPLPRAGLPR